MSTATQKSKSWTGQALPRKEDDRLVRGRGKFVDDYKMPGMLHLRIVRSPYAHARILSVDTSAAEKAPGVVCTLTGKEIAGLTSPFMEIGPDVGQKIVDYPMAVDKVRYQGEPVAAVVADTRYAAEDAAEMVQVDYEALDPVLTPEQAYADKSIIHEAAGTNVTWKGNFHYGDVDKAFKDAAYIVHIDRMHFDRFSSTPLENNAVIGQWDAKDNAVDFISNNSFPVIGLQMLAPHLGVHIDKIRTRSYDIGGSFGIKITNYTYMAICALASRKAGGYPVKWIETRTEHMQASAHGNERTFLDTRIALDKNGVITAIDSRHIDDCGAYPRYEPLGCIIWAQVLPATLRLRNMRIEFSQIITNKCPVGPNRGYSRMQHLWFMERCLDICAHELGIAPDEMRLRNYIRPDEMPYTTPNGCIYDSGNYPEMLRMAKQLIGWDEWKKKQSEARQQGRWIGIGIGSTLDSGTNNFGQARIVNPYAPFSGNSKAANVKLDIYGEVVVSLGSVPQGQGHETTASQIVADVLKIPPDMISVKPGFDTDFNVHTGHTGTYASQFAVTGLSAIHGAAVKLRNEMKQLAAFALQVSEDDLEFGVGKEGPELRAKGTDKYITYGGLANIINVNNAGLPDDMDVTLNCRYVYRPPFKIPDLEKKYGNLTLTYSAQVHIAVVEVERDTYIPRILAYTAVEDCGTAVNPMIVEGQVMGCTAHGIGAAIMETCAYDPAGNMLTSTFSDYTPITAVNMPKIIYGHMESPSPFTFNGAKGMGEGGACPVHTMCAALQDALHSTGVIMSDSHNTPDSLFRAITAAKSGERGAQVRVEKRV